MPVESDKSRVEAVSTPQSDLSRPSGALKRKALRSLGDLPPFSAILNRLLASLAGDNISYAKIGDLIEKDTVIAGNLLQLVNSALYGRRGTINSVRHALSLLGVEKVRNAVLGMSISRMWRQMKMPGSWSIARFNMHSASVAILCDLVAGRLPVAYPEGAFVAGLLHDVGRMVIAQALPEEYARIEGMVLSGRPRLDCELEVLGFTHPALSADALEAWNLPAPIRAAVLKHHHGQAPGNGEVPLSRVLQAADNYVNSTGVSIPLKPDPDSANPALIEALGLEDGLGRCLTEFQAEYKAMSGFFK